MLNGSISFRKTDKYIFLSVTKVEMTPNKERSVRETNIQVLGGRIRDLCRKPPGTARFRELQEELVRYVPHLICISRRQQTRATDTIYERNVRADCFERNEEPAV